MITRTRQSWEVGQRVKVGFLSLTVSAKVPTPGDYMPDKYVLVADNGRTYEFTPHYGLSRID
jgi:hypothetical protein